MVIRQSQQATQNVPNKMLFKKVNAARNLYGRDPRSISYIVLADAIHKQARPTDRNRDRTPDPDLPHKAAN
jgi:hypothetical protein